MGRTAEKILLGTAAALAGAIALLAGGFLVWAGTPLGPGIASLDAMASDSSVTVTRHESWTEFAPAALQGSSPPNTAFVFYPGGRVDWRSYAPILKKIAGSGFLAIVIPVRLNLAFFEVDAASSPMRAHPEIGRWAVGGHSLGGVAAAIYASKNTDQVGGVVFWASYPVDDALRSGAPNSAKSPAGGSAAGSGQPVPRVLSVSASNDGLATAEKIAASRLRLPDDAEFTVIDGGNHAGFGDYGPQQGDNPANIPQTDQWERVASATASFLAGLR